MGVEIFRTRPNRPWGSPILLHNGYRASFPGVKRSGHGVNHQPPTIAEVTERVELYLHCPCGSSRHVLEQTLQFTFYRDFINHSELVTLSTYQFKNHSFYTAPHGVHLCFFVVLRKAIISPNSISLNAFTTETEYINCEVKTEGLPIIQVNLSL